jgi:uncharacterized protein (TIGR02147 family)
MKTIFEYLDYRSYLSDVLKDRKRMNHHFSYRFISQHLDLKSSAFIHRVIKGDKKLPESLIPKIAELLKLDEKEKEFFLILVKFNHCIDASQREELFRKLERFVKNKKVRELEPAQYRLFTRWFYVAIRELLRIKRFEDDYHALAVSLQPKIKNKEARAAIQTLEKIGLIAKGPDGAFRPLEIQVTTGDLWESELIKNLQIQFAEMGKNAIVAVPKQKRDISNLTFCASEATMRRISEEIAALRLRILDLADNDNASDTVYQCNLQLFPIGYKDREGSHE